MNLKEKLMRLEGLELARTQKPNLATNQSPLNPVSPADAPPCMSQRILSYYVLRKTSMSRNLWKFYKIKAFALTCVTTQGQQMASPSVTR